MRIQVEINGKSVEVTHNAHESNSSSLLKETCLHLLNVGTIQITEASPGQVKIVSGAPNKDLDELFSDKATQTQTKTDPTIKKVTFDINEIDAWFKRTFNTPEKVTSLSTTIKVQKYSEFQDLLKQGLRQGALVMPDINSEWNIENFMPSNKNNDRFKLLLTEDAKAWFNFKYNGKEAKENRNFLCKITVGLPSTVITSSSANFIGDNKPEVSHKKRSVLSRVFQF